MLKHLKHKVKIAKELRTSYPLLTDLIKKQEDRLAFLRQLKRNGIEFY